MCVNLWNRFVHSVFIEHYYYAGPSLSRGEYAESWDEIPTQKPWSWVKGLGWRDTWRCVQTSESCLRDRRGGACCLRRLIQCFLEEVTEACTVCPKSISGRGASTWKGREFWRGWSEVKYSENTAWRGVTVGEAELVASVASWRVFYALSLFFFFPRTVSVCKACCLQPLKDERRKVALYLHFQSDNLALGWRINGGRWEVVGLLAGERGMEVEVKGTQSWPTLWSRGLSMGFSRPEYWSG